MDVRDPFVFVHFNGQIVKKILLGSIDRLIKEGNICTTFNVLIQKRLIILNVNHISRCNQDIFLWHICNIRKVVYKTGNGRIVQIIRGGMFGKEGMNTTSLGIDIVLSSGTDMVG